VISRQSNSTLIRMSLTSMSKCPCLCRHWWRTSWREATSSITDSTYGSSTWKSGKRTYYLMTLQCHPNNN